MENENNSYFNLFDRLTDNAQYSLKKAEENARQLGSSYVGTEHLLLGVLAQESSFAAKLLGERGVSFRRARQALSLTPKKLHTAGAIATTKGLSETAKMTLRMSWDVAREFNQQYCGTEHILFSILSQKNARATILLRDMNISIDNLVGELNQYLSRQQDEYERSLQEGTVKAKRVIRRRLAIDYFGIDLTDRARKNLLDPLVGRESQLARMITILNRRTKNNPVLIGLPGVGKTAIVEGLAQRIATSQVPIAMQGFRIIQIDLSAMIAGTKYRGEFEERLKKVIEELTTNRNLIAFIDELHLLVGAGAAEGAIDAGNILKPALARGDVRVIGATTTDEYSKHIEKDAALERRFQPILVPEATVEETLAILRGLKSRYENHHGVMIADELLDEVVRFAGRYISDRYFPDKAIDVLDETAAYVKVARGVVSNEEKRLMLKLRQTAQQMETAATRGDYESAARHKAHSNDLADRLSIVRKKNRRDLQMKVRVEDIRQSVANMSGVPVQKLAQKEAEDLLRLETRLSKRIIGQDEAVAAISKAIRRNRSGMSDGRRPIGSFIFLGPTGVGKTEMARVLADTYFGSVDALLKIDMSEFSEKHTVSRLIGAPAGYIGYEEEGQLTAMVRRHPHRVILFDEIEKAHPDLFNILLQIMEDGYLTDAKSRRIDFRNTIIVLTSNIGAEKLQKEASLGFQAEVENQRVVEDLHDRNVSLLTSQLKKMMRPELLNRLDGVVVFRSLSREQVKKILRLELGMIRLRMHQQGIGLRVTVAAQNRLIDEGYDIFNGVRPLKRLLQHTVEDRIADDILRGSLTRGDVIQVGAIKGGFTFKLISG